MRAQAAANLQLVLGEMFRTVKANLAPPKKKGGDKAGKKKK